MKKACCVLISLFFFIFSVYADEIDVSGENVVLYNLNDDAILFSKNASEKSEIASLTKIMTSLVVIDSVDDLSSKVTISSKDFEGTNGYSKAGFNIGDNVTYEDLLYGILLPSGADAVNAAVNNTLKEDFVPKMNDIAKKICMDDTVFSNPVGKDEGNYSTALDVLKMLKYALKNDTFKRIFTTKSYTTTNGILLSSTLSSYDNILDTSIITGAKSGFTKKAGRCLASITSLDDANLLLVVINSNPELSYNAVKDTIDIYTYYKDNYSYQTIIDDDTFIKKIPIVLSSKANYKITGSESIDRYLKNDTDVNYVYEGISKINYQTKKGEKIGVVKIYDGDDLLAVSNLYLEEKIDYYPVYLGVIFLLVIVLIVYFKKKKRKRRRKK